MIITKLLPSDIRKALLNNFWHLLGGFMYEWCISSNIRQYPFDTLQNLLAPFVKKGHVPQLPGLS